MDVVRILLEEQPLMALFLTIAIGYLVGEIDVGRLSLGVGAVLFVALGVGWFAPKAVPAAMVGTLGLAVFLYAVGIQYGKQFVLGLTRAGGRRANVIALVGVLCAAIASLLVARTMGLNPGHALGLFAGSGTSTPTLQAAIATVGNDDPAVGYSMTYPIGVAGPILLLYVAFRLVKPSIDAVTAGDMAILEIAIRNGRHFGRPLGELMRALPADVTILALRTGHHNHLATHDHVVAANDVVLVAAADKELLAEARRALGEAAPGRVADDRSDLDFLCVFASQPRVVGSVLGEIALPAEKAVVIAHVRRGDTCILPRSDLLLEFGDRVGLLAHGQDFAALRTFFGDSTRGTAEFSYVSIGVGVALGLLLGAIPIPLPGIGRFSVGLSGVLIVALVLGNLRRTRRITWAIPLSANLVLRNLGLTLFLAQVGMASGPKFAAAVTQTGLQMFGLGALIVAALVLPILVIGLLVYRMPFDEVAGIASGACGSAVLAYSNRMMPTDRPDIGYAMIYPGTTIAKILFVSIVPSLLG